MQNNIAPDKGLWRDPLNTGFAFVVVYPETQYRKGMIIEQYRSCKKVLYIIIPGIPYKLIVDDISIIVPVCETVFQSSVEDDDNQYNNCQGSK